MMNLEQIMQEVSQITESGLPLMEGRTQLKVEGSILDNTFTVDEYGYLEGDEGEYVVISLKEYPEHFIYGSSVVTQTFKKLDEKFNKEIIDGLLEKGLTFKLSKMLSKKTKRKYTKITFFPNN